MDNSPYVVIEDHDDGTYTMADARGRVVLERVNIWEITQHLEDTDRALHPLKLRLEENQDEPPVAIALARDAATFLTLTSDPISGRLKVRDTRTDQLLAQGISVSQLLAAIQQYHGDVSPKDEG